MVTLGDTRNDAHALVDTVADTLVEVKTMTLRHTRQDADAHVDIG